MRALQSAFLPDTLKTLPPPRHQPLYLYFNLTYLWKNFYSHSSLSAQCVAKAAEESYTIKFKQAANNSGSQVTSSTAVSTIVEEGADYLGAVVSATNTYAPGHGGIRVGTSQANGSIEINFSDANQPAPTKVEFYVGINGSASLPVTITLNGEEQSATITETGITNASPLSAYHVFTFEDPGVLQSFSMAKTKFTKSNYTYLNRIIVYYESDFVYQPIGEFNVSPDATTVEYGTTVSFEAENATKYSYEIDGTVVEGNSFTLTESCEVTMYAHNPEYSASIVRSFTVAEPEYVYYHKVSSLDYVEEGAEYIIAGEYYNKTNKEWKRGVMGALNKNNRYSVSPEMDGATIKVLNEEVTVLNVVKNSDGTCSFAFDKDGTTTYLDADAANNYLKESTSIGSTSKFTLSFDAEGYLLAKIAVGNKNYRIAYNSSSNLFAKYSSDASDTNASIMLYRKVTESDPKHEAPEALYAHGHIGGALIHWSPVELTTNANGFSHESLSFFITDEEAEMDADAHFFLSAKPAEVAEIAPMTVEAGSNVDFTNVLNDVVYAPAEDTELTTGTVALKAYPANSFATAAEIPTFKAKANQSYAVDVDFSGFHPVMNVSSTTLVSVDKVTVDSNEPVEYFNLQGVRVQNPANGVFIRRQGAVATKVRLW